MNNVLKLKYKMHRLVNIIFYGIIFIIGFIAGLAVDSASAYEISTSIGNINEEWIYNQFSNIEGFDISRHSNVACTYSKNKTGSLESIMCYAVEDISLLRFESYSNIYYLYLHQGYTSFEYNLKSNQLTSSNFVDSCPSTSNCAYFRFSTTPNTYFSYNYITSYTNFDSSSFDSSINSVINKLDFSSFSALTYNPNLFKDNPDFKEVCIDKNSKVSIISNNYTQLNDSVINYEVEDFMWFDDGVKVPGYIYDSDTDAMTHMSEDDANNLISWNYYFNNKENINKYFNENVNAAKLTSVFNNGGYGDKNNYYGYTAIPFYYYGVKYVDGSVLSTYLSIHDFSKIKDFTEKECATIAGSTTCIGNSGTQHGGGGTRLPIDEEIETEVNDNSNICFYIKNEYEVVEYEIDEWGDIYADFEILGGNNMSIDSSIMQDNADTDSLFGSINTFLKKISTTLELIKDNVYNFYLSMPLLLRLFIISFFTILIIKFIIGMVVR